MFDSDILRRQSCIKHPRHPAFRLTPLSMKLHDTRFTFRGGGRRSHNKQFLLLAVIVILGSHCGRSNAFEVEEVEVMQQPTPQLQHDTIYVDSGLMNDLNDWLGKLNRKVS